MLLQRITYINNDGYPCSRVLRIIKKKSKTIRVQVPDDGHEFEINRLAVESISDIKKEDKDE